MPNLYTHYHFKLDFQKVDHTRGKWLTHGTKHCKDNQLQSLELFCKYPCRKSKHYINECKGDMFNPMLKENFILSIHVISLPPQKKKLKKNK